MTALRVLLVDDEALALKRLATLFGDIDEVELVGTASTGREAEEKIASLSPDLVMLDISMPQKSGLRVAADRLAALPAPEASRTDAIWVQVSGGQIRLPIDQIEWIEAAKDYVMLHTATRSFIHRISMAALEALLDPEGLMRVHRSTFIRPALVGGVQRLGKGLIALEMRDGAVVQVGPSYVKAVLARLGLD